MSPRIALLALASLPFSLLAVDVPVPLQGGTVDLSPANVRDDRPVYVGVEIIPVDDPTRSLFKLPPTGGLLAIGVAPASPADGKLGQGDILLKLDDQLLVNREQLRSLLHSRKAGDPASFTVVRGGRSETVVVKLAAVPALTLRAASPDAGGPFDPTRADELLRRLTERTRGMLNESGLDPALLDRAGGNASVTVNGVPVQNSGSGITFSSSRTLVRPEGRVSTVTTNGKTTVVVKDASGKVIAEGEPDAAFREKLPDWAKEALDSKPPAKKSSGAPETPVARGGDDASGNAGRAG